MNKMNKTLSVLVSTLVMAGCSVNVAQLSNKDSVIVDNVDVNAQLVTLQEIYESAYTSSGKTFVVNQILDLIARAEMEKNKGDRSHNYSEEYLNGRIQEKLDTYAASSTYKVDGQFSEERFALTLLNQGYAVTCGDSFSSDPKDLSCDYSDYKERFIRPIVYREILNEEYIFADPNGLDFFVDTEIREVEYFYMTKIVDERFDYVSMIEENGAVSLESIETLWKDFLKSEIDTEVAKIGTDDDKYKTIENKYSGNNTYPVAHGVYLAKLAIDNADYTYEKVITDTDSTFSTTLEAKLFDEDVADKFITIDGVNYFPSLNDPDQLIVTDNAKYYFIRVRVIDENSSDADKEAAAKTLAAISANVTSSIQYYLDLYNLTVYEEDLFTYLNETYDFGSEE